MNYQNELPDEFREMDLLYLEEIQYQKEEHHNEVICTINSTGPAFNTKVGATAIRGEIQQTSASEEHRTDSDKSCR